MSFCLLLVTAQVGPPQGPLEPGRGLSRAGLALSTCKPLRNSLVSACCKPLALGCKPLSHCCLLLCLTANQLFHIVAWATTCTSQPYKNWPALLPSMSLKPSTDSTDFDQLSCQAEASSHLLTVLSVFWGCQSVQNGLHVCDAGPASNVKS